MNKSERGNSFLRLIDENLGPLLVGLLGIYTRMLRALGLRRRPTNPKIIQILKLAGIGDLVLLSATIADLKAWKPNVKIVLVVASSNSAYARLLPLVDDVLVVPIGNPLKAIQMLRTQPADILINADSWARLSALLGAMSAAKWVLGFKTPGQYRHFADDELVPHRADLHEIDNDRALIAALGVPVGLPPLSPHFDKLRSETGVIVLHLWPGGTKSHLREWPIEFWRELITRLGRRTPENFLLTGAPDQKTLNENFILSLNPELQSRVRNAAGVSMKETIALVADARVLITVDTGVMHIGAALGVPVISLHGPSNPRRWGPVGNQVYPLQSQTPGAGRLILGFEYDSDQNYMTGLSVDEVENCTKKVLGLL